MGFKLQPVDPRPKRAESYRLCENKCFMLINTIIIGKILPLYVNPCKIGLFTYRATWLPQVLSVPVKLGCCPRGPPHSDTACACNARYTKIEVINYPFWRNTTLNRYLFMIIDLSRQAHTLPLLLQFLKYLCLLNFFLFYRAIQFIDRISSIIPIMILFNILTCALPHTPYPLSILHEINYTTGNIIWLIIH